MKKIMNVGLKGFTLVELMIVVAIIGILAAVGIPQYSKFQNKARQSDAKVSLGAMYTVEQAFRAETGVFSGCLANIGYTPPTATYYGTGVTPGTFLNTGGAGSANCVAAVGNTNFTATRNATNTSGANATFANAGTTNITNGNQFNLGAGGWVGGTQADQWKIDDLQQLVNTQQGF